MKRSSSNIGLFLRVRKRSIYDHLNDSEDHPEHNIIVRSDYNVEIELGSLSAHGAILDSKQESTPVDSAPHLSELPIKYFVGDGTETEHLEINFDGLIPHYTTSEDGVPMLQHDPFSSQEARHPPCISEKMAGSLKAIHVKKLLNPDSLPLRLTRKLNTRQRYRSVYQRLA